LTKNRSDQTSRCARLEWKTQDCWAENWALTEKSAWGNFHILLLFTIFFLTQKWWSWCWWWACVWKDSFDCITSTNEFSLTIVVVFLADFDAASYTTFPFRLFFCFYKIYTSSFFSSSRLACLLVVCMNDDFLFFSFFFCFSTIL